jgi:NADH dehydrogenase (ubiquinone) 1 alpha subcomplex subunit 13
MVNSELAREKMWSRIHLIPLLTAEEDRDLVRRHLADQKRELDLMGSQTGPYNSDRYVPLSVLLCLDLGF